MFWEDARKGKRKSGKANARLILEFPPVNASECVVTASHDALDESFKFKSAAFAVFLSQRGTEGSLRSRHPSGLNATKIILT